MSEDRKGVRRLLESLKRELRMLENDIATYRQQIQAAESERERVLTAIDVITKRQGADADRPPGFADMTIGQAAVLVLEEHSRALKTREICDQMVEWGFKSEAKDFYTTVYATLKRLESRSELMLEEGRWYLPRFLEDDEEKSLF